MSAHSVSNLAGKLPPVEMLVDVGELIRRYYETKPEYDRVEQRVSFGTSGHRGSSLSGTFTETHVLVITQAICDFRTSHGITGPLLVGKDTHGLSSPAQKTVLEVLAGNGVQTIVQSDDEVTPTPVISHAILERNRGRTDRLADGIILTPSHNPPEDAGIKYNSIDGGPSDTKKTRWIENRANEILRNGLADLKRQSYTKSLQATTTTEEDFLLPYVRQLDQVVDMGCIRDSGLRVGVNPLGGASVRYWEIIRDHYRLDLSVLDTRSDPTFFFIPVDHDGKIRTDCSSPWVMSQLAARKNEFGLICANDADCDRHGIVVPSNGLMAPNHFLAASIHYLLQNRPLWRGASAIGKTMVSSSIIDRLVKSHGRELFEVPVGFKWFSSGLYQGSLCFAGEESAGASFLRRDGTVWTTDKDGFILDFLAAEMTAKMGKDPAMIYREIEERLGGSFYTRIDIPVAQAAKKILQSLTPDAITTKELAGDPILKKWTRAPANDESLGGIKVETENGWFAVRPSGTEELCKIYAESFHDRSHLASIIEEAQAFVRAECGT
ncbi:MAG: alpha-D-glucose phosphate-specific phosphoglucomutase [Cryobacterium sp.]|nr:alpha-D-glucose phosphate-specific phosphoglucomutase [Oligoflexia bacterium]